MEYTNHWESALGTITLAGDGEALTGLWFDGQKHFGAGLDPEREERDLPVFAEARTWLTRYFAGEAPGPTPPLRLKGTAFQQAVWRRLLEIPYGETVTYGALARDLAAQRGAASPRAVGGAVGRNPISLIVPCHRVLGAGGRLTGYAGGLERKKWLLKHEAGGGRDL